MSRIDFPQSTKQGSVLRWENNAQGDVTMDLFVSSASSIEWYRVAFVMDRGAENAGAVEDHSMTRCPVYWFERFGGVEYIVAAVSVVNSCCSSVDYWWRSLVDSNWPRIGEISMDLVMMEQLLLHRPRLRPRPVVDDLYRQCTIPNNSKVLRRWS